VKGSRNHKPSFCVAYLIVLLSIVAPTVHLAFGDQQRNSLISQAVDFCADKVVSPNNRYAFITTNVSTINDERTVLCFDGVITEDVDLSVFYQLQEQGLVVIRSVGGSTFRAMTIAEILLQKDVSVVVRDLCLSACANAIFVASNRTYVLESAVIAWHGGPSDCQDPTIKAALSRLQRPCTFSDPARKFFEKRGIGSRHTVMPQTTYTKNRFKIILESAPDRRSVLWMWHPKNQKGYFKNTITYESYPESQEAVDAIIRKFRLYIRVVYDPID
jgi:hypothetical protein